jgi:hypothetical protein
MKDRGLLVVPFEQVRQTFGPDKGVHMTTMEYTVFRRLQKEGSLRPEEVTSHEHRYLDSLVEKGLVVVRETGWTIV